MKKKLSVVFALALSAVMLFVLCACGSTWGKIKSAYEKEGYTEIELSEEIKEALHLSDEDTEESDATVHFLTNAKVNDDDSTLELIAKIVLSKTAIVWEYKNVEAVQKAYKEDLNEEQQEKFDELWKEYQKSDKVNGNCILVIGDAAIFKGTK